MSNEVIKQINFLIYDEAQVKAVLKDESIWLSQKGMAELFSVNVSAISKHLKNIFSEGELTQSATVSILEIVQIEGGRSIKRNVEFYNLDAIISVGYRINSTKATKFRIWATNVLKEFIKKGFVLFGSLAIISKIRPRRFERSFCSLIICFIFAPFYLKIEPQLY